MSHEIRRPINGVFAMIQMLIDIGINQNKKQFMEVIDSKSTSLLAVICDILVLSTLESGEILLDYFAVNFYYLLDESTGFFAAQNSGGRLKFNILIPPDTPAYFSWGLFKGQTGNHSLAEQCL
jgi:signal transduction histidine kinase